MWKNNVNPFTSWLMDMANSNFKWIFRFIGFFYILWSSIVHFLWMYFDLSLAKYNQVFLKTNDLLRHNIVPVMNWNWTLDRVWAVYRDLHQQKKWKFKTRHLVHPRYLYKGKFWRNVILFLPGLLLRSFLHHFHSTISDSDLPCPPMSFQRSQAQKGTRIWCKERSLSRTSKKHSLRKKKNR